MSRAALFAVVGVGSFGIWLRTVTSDDQSGMSSDWFVVISFSAMLIGLAFAPPVFGQVVGGHVISRLSLIPAAGAALAAVSKGCPSLRN